MSLRVCLALWAAGVAWGQPPLSPGLILPCVRAARVVSEERAGNVETAERIVEEAAQQAMRAGDKGFRGRVALWIGTQLQSTRESRVIGDRARRWLDLAIVELENGPPHLLARALQHAGVLTVDVGPRRLKLERALAAARASGDTLAVARVETDLGEAVRRSGDFAGAIRMLKPAAEHLAAAGEWVDSARAYAMLGRAYGLHGHFAQARAAYDRAREYCRKAGDRVAEVFVMAEYAILLVRHEQPRAAVALFDQVRAYLAGERVPAGVRLRMGGLAYAYVKVGECQKAVEVASEVQRQFPRRAPAAVPATLSAAYYCLGRYGEAVEAANAGVTQRLNPVAGRADAFRHRARALDRLGRHAEAASDILEAARLDEFLRERMVDEDEWRLAYENFRSPLADDLVEILWNAGRHREAFDAAERYRGRAFLDRIADGGSLGSPPPKPATVSQVAAYAGGLGGPLIAYWVHPAALFEWVVTPDGKLHTARVPIAEKKLDGLAARARSLQYKTDRDAWRSLHRILIAPVASWLPRGTGGRIAVVPHRVLLELPFAALLDPAGSYLVERYNPRIGVAAAVLIAGRDPEKGARRTVLVGAPQDGLALPGARNELSRIATLVDRGATILAGPGAREGRVRDEAPRAGVLHFATHAVIDPAQPMESFLMLSRGDRLTAGEVYTMSLHANLVVLSACRAAGGRVSIDGLLSLTRAFLSAGAATVIAPVWDVPDHPTARLMEEFYRKRRDGGSNGDALRTAQLKLLADLRAGRVVVDTAAGPMPLPEQPVLWAGFVLYGAE